MQNVSLPLYEVRIIPALHSIQDQYGYLKREALEAFAAESDIPLHRLQSVASFFPHFHLAPPPELTVKVCRDMACHLAGADMMGKLAGLADGKVRIEGVSCLGRCDRAPAASVTFHETGEERYYLGCTPVQLEKIISRCRAGSPPTSNRDAELPYPSAGWLIDPYAGATPDYAAVKKAIEARGRSLQLSVDLLSSRMSWSHLTAEQFRAAAERRLRVEFTVEDDVRDAVLAWQTQQDWAAGTELGGWADQLLEELDDAHADLRGMGGAGIPATQKWRDVRDAVRTARLRHADDRAYIVVNGDESEPGTFKDRELLLRMPHLIVEGVILAGLITDASEGIIYIRHEYEEQIATCRKEIERAEKLGICGRDASVLGRPFMVSVFVSPGGYICGEQSALIEAMSDRRAEPRNLPPKLETNGLDDRPTLVSNVETFAWAPYILLKGGKAYAELGVNGCKGRRFFSVSGDVNSPGVYEVPMGLTLRELIYGREYCQGMLKGRKLKAIAPSGPSGGFLPATLKAGAGLPRDHARNKAWIELAGRRGFAADSSDLDILDMELELNLFRALSPTQALGAGIVVYADDRDLIDQAVNAVEFFRNESCGKCVPCRIGSQKLAAAGHHILGRGIHPDRWNDEMLPTFKELASVMELTSICGLGRSVSVPMRTVIEFFPDDLSRYIAAAGAATKAPVKEVSR